MIAAVVGLSTYLQARIVAKAVEAEELDAAAAIALGVSADLGEHIQAPTTAELVDLLADYRKAVPAVRSITVTAVAPPWIVAGTDAAVPDAALGLGERAVAQGEPVSFADGPMGLHLVAVPLERQRQRYGAVVVAVGMDALRRVQDQSRQAAFVFAAVAIVLLVIGARPAHAPLRARAARRRCSARWRTPRRATSPRARRACGRTRSGRWPRA